MNERTSQEPFQLTSGMKEKPDPAISSAPNKLP